MTLDDPASGSVPSQALPLNFSRGGWSALVYFCSNVNFPWEELKTWVLQSEVAAGEDLRKPVSGGEMSADEGTESGDPCPCPSPIQVSGKTAYRNIASPGTLRDRHLHDT